MVPAPMPLPARTSTTDGASRVASTAASRSMSPNHCCPLISPISSTGGCDPGHTPAGHRRQLRPLAYCQGQLTRLATTDDPQGCLLADPLRPEQVTQLSRIAHWL